MKTTKPTESPFSKNDSHWQDYAPIFETQKAQDPQPNWFFQEHLFADLSVDQSKVLDIGCGSGRGIWAIQKQIGHFPIGLDISKQALAQAEENKIPAENLILSNYKTDPLPSECDVIWISDLLLYLDPETELLPTMKKLNQALKDGGRLGFRWSVGQDELLIRKQSVKFLVSEKFIRNLLKESRFHLQFLEQRKDPIYVANDVRREGRGVFTDCWYVLATKKN